MVIQDPPFFMPLFWPLGHLATMLGVSNDDTPSKPRALPFLDVAGHLTSFCAALRAWLMAIFCVYVLYEDYSYPGFGAGAELQWSWMRPIVYRNMFATALIAGGWDYLLYFSPLKDRLRRFKLTKEYPSMAQIQHDVFWTFTASLSAAMIEIFLCYMWSNNYFHYDSKSLLDRPLVNMLWACTIMHWRSPHFYAIHRAMHPWKTTIFPDVGAILYKKVHSLHHKSYNPTAFSGTSMHPVESTLYYTAALLCIPFGCHPTIALGCIIDCGVGAWLGHDGFQWPGSGDYFHQLHHLHFDCNYGAGHVPLDWWFGTFIREKNDLKKIWGKKSQTVGKASNIKDYGCKVHPQ
mmetsp:Transcript_15181/g.23014  ORF Transcript_15181/g.23014 Transcript_15181/m.23014 type:complete len:348 (+) Transcript_15181:38-1081(+)